jgi:hypothetical protein
MKRFLDRMHWRASESIGRSLNLFKPGFMLIPVMILTLTPQVFSYWNEEEAAKNSTPEMTEEEKEIIRDREILENLVLLQNLDAIDFIDLLNEMEPDWLESEESDNPAKDKEEGVQNDKE